jgi:hypothetical protein
VPVLGPYSRALKNYKNWGSCSTSVNYDLVYNLTYTNQQSNATSCPNPQHKNLTNFKDKTCVYWKANKDSNRLFGIVGRLCLKAKIRRISEGPCHEKAKWNFSNF